MTGAQILVVDDEANIRDLLDEILSEEGYEVTTAADADSARAARRGQSYDLTLLDIWMPGTDGISLLKEWSDTGRLDPVIMMSGHGTVDTAVEATRLGALDFIEKPVSLTKLLRTVAQALESRRERPPRAGGHRQTRTPIGKSEALQHLKEDVSQLSKLETNVVFAGERGSGRALFARYLVAASHRSVGPFETLRGRHLTDADAARILLGAGDQPGALQRATGGVLFIDGIDDIGSEAERLLLDAIRNRRIQAPDGQGSIPIDVRLLASMTVTGRLAPGNETVAGLGAVVLRVPPLREHSEDVPELLRVHAERLVDEQRLPFRRFSIAAQNRLRNYPWPGNVTQLHEVVRHLLVFGTDEEIGLGEVEEQLKTDADTAEPLIKQDLLALPLREAREHFERAYLTQQLELCGGKVGKLAKRVGMERTHLYRKLRALGVDFRQTGSDD